MPEPRAQFGSVETTADFTERKPAARKYMGQERRRGHRRISRDRRQEIRFEFNKEDRRQQRGRRDGENTPSFW